jgi:hypothetical protein
MMLPAIETVAKADPVRQSRRHDSDISAQATAGESVHAYGSSTKLSAAWQRPPKDDPRGHDSEKNALLSIASGGDCRRLDHQNDGSLGGSCAVDDPFGHDKPLLRRELDSAILEIDDESAGKDKEELVVLVVLVPVVLTLHYTETDNRVVNSAKSLVVPPCTALRRQRGNVYKLQWLEQYVEKRLVRILVHSTHAPSRLDAILKR